MSDLLRLDKLPGPRANESLDDLWAAYDKAVGEGSPVWVAEFRRRITERLAATPSSRAFTDMDLAYEAGREDGRAEASVEAVERPTLADFDKFTDEQFAAYVKAIGFEGDIEAALAEVRTGRASAVGLDAAWAEALAAFPEGWGSVNIWPPFPGDPWTVQVTKQVRTGRGGASRYNRFRGEGRDLAEALRNLAARLAQEAEKP